MNFFGYIKPYLFITNGGRYTKHIYAGTQRIASKLGDIEAFGADPRRVVTAGHDVENIEPIDYGKKYSAQNNAFKARFDSLDSKFNGKSLDDYVNGKSFCCGENSLDEIEKNNTQTAENAKLEDNLYFYHPDHLGSTSMVTNYDGEVSQNVAYIPYGEVFVEDRNGSWATPFLFNAKELDEETGLYYYGARYLDPMDCRWLSVDPVFHPGASPYAYCLGNPVRLVDPDGREEYFSENGDHVGSGTNKDDKAKYVVSDKKEVKTIKKNGKSGSDTDVKDLKSAYKLPSDAVLEEALDLLGETKKHKGKQEISTLVNKNGEALKYQIGEAWENEKEIPSTKLPTYNGSDSDIESSIHSHPYVVVGNSFSPADYAGPGDPDVFSRFNTNIIVGKGNGDVKMSNDPIKGTNIYDYREFGVAFFGANVQKGQKCDLWINEKALNKIISTKR